MDANIALRQRWLKAMRECPVRAIGRECDFAMSEGDVDRYDPIGLLALEADWDFTDYPGCDGQYVPRMQAEYLAGMVGFPPDRLYDLCLMNDAGEPWPKIAAWCEWQMGLVK